MELFLSTKIVTVTLVLGAIIVTVFIYEFKKARGQLSPSPSDTNENPTVSRSLKPLLIIIPSIALVLFFGAALFRANHQDSTGSKDIASTDTNQSHFRKNGSLLGDSTTETGTPAVFQDQPIPTNLPRNSLQTTSKPTTSAVKPVVPNLPESGSILPTILIAGGGAVFFLAAFFLAL